MHLNYASNVFIFPDLGPLIINILYGRSGIYAQFGLHYVLFSPVTSSKLIIFYIQFLCFNMF